MEQHIKGLNKVIYQLELANMKVSVSKTKLTQLEVQVLRHLVNIDGILPNPQKISRLKRII